MPLLEIAEVYRRFATVEAAGRSPVYAEITDRISRDPRTLSFLAALPPPKRQPNLLLAAVQYLSGRLTGWDVFAAALAERGPGSLTSSTHTPLRPTSPPAAQPCCRSRQLPQPLALVEAGASAGLCLYPTVRLRLRRLRPARHADPALHGEPDDTPAP